MWLWEHSENAEWKQMKRLFSRKRFMHIICYENNVAEIDIVAGWDTKKKGKERIRSYQRFSIKKQTNRSILIVSHLLFISSEASSSTVV